MSNNTFNGFNELLDELENYISIVDNNQEILEIGAKEFVSDLKKLPKPISEIKRSNYTHLIDTFGYRKNKDEIEVYWGKYYGPMLEGGTTKMGSRPHLKPLWEKNKIKYYDKMLKIFK